ncbi:MAG: 16S rRNA (guanine(527)-N(7))-methyltransferase RsmG [Desulfococcaceae bacterium]
MNIGSRDWNHLIVKGCGEFGIGISPEKCGLMARHAADLLAWNRKMNLTAITEPEDMAVKHYMDSLIPARFIPAGSKLLDIGSGAGFPGIPLKIFDSSLILTMLDSVRKKVSFLQYAISSLSLKDTDAVHGRAEDFGKQAVYAHAFDAVICRALSDLGKFAKLALPFLKPEGRMIAMKGKISEEEIAPVREQLSVDVEKYNLPVSGAERTLLIMRSK